MRLLLVGMLLILSGCGQGYPEPECDTNPHFEDSELRCSAAVEVALDAMPTEKHTAITRIQFLHGSATPCCSYLYPPDHEAPERGYVVFTFSGAREYVPIEWWRGTLTAGPLAEY